MGLQRQAHGPSVQESVERAVFEVTGERATLHSAGRTDSGVHALAMVSHIEIAKALTPFRLMEALNARLRPEPIAVIACEMKPDDWHARFSCIGRRYLYRVCNRRAPLTLEHGRAWHVSRPLDAEAMHRAGQLLVGRHDFTTFRSIHCQAKSPLRTLDRLDVTRAGDLIEVRTSARSFLHNQVRSMVGTLKRVGEGAWNAAAVKAALEAKDRATCGAVAPPEGLYLAKVDYSTGT